MDHSAHPSDTTGLAAPIAAGIFGGFALLALVNAVLIAAVVPVPAAGWSLRVGHHAFDAAETLGLGAVVASVVGGFVKFARIPVWAMRGVGFVAALLMINAVIGEYIGLQAAHLLRGRLELPIRLVTFALLGGAFIEVPAVAAAVARIPGCRLVPLAVATVLLLGDHIPLRDDYVGIHGLIAFGAALTAGPSLAPIVLGAARGLARSTRGRIELGAVAVISLAGLGIAPPNAVRCELFRQPCAVAPWVLATTLWSSPALHSKVSIPNPPWLADRSSFPPIGPTFPVPLPDDAVVVLITIDALRADVVSSRDHDGLLPTLAELRRTGVMFTHASAPGTQTPLSLSTMFSGRYFSEQRWANFGEGFDRFPYPADDPLPRFPELLVSHGVLTVQESAYVFLASPFGVARGFTEEKVFGESRAAAPARRLIGAMLERLAGLHDEPIFAYAHLAEPHGPYRLGRKEDDDYHRYLAAAASADAQLARLVRFLEERMGNRWVLIVSADHGEAFGEHETFDHSKTLYEELLHVPLLVRSPAFLPRQVDERVGLVDLGPTILDLFGVSTPATWNGQSLVPLLLGGDTALSRPLFAEGRLRTAFTQRDGFKVIEDPRRKVVEAYDLTRDPHETRNVFDTEPTRADTALAFMRAFFSARTRREGGYTPPYKP